MPTSPVHADHSDGEALLLVESLLHELIACGTLTLDRAVAVVEIAADTRDQLRDAQGLANPYDGRALDAILATLGRDRS